MSDCEHPRCQTQICNLSLKVGGTQILKDISFQLLCHQFSAIIGTNGAGKSSLLRCLTGELKGEGFIYFKNEKHPPKIGYVPQKLHFDRDSPLTTLDLFLLAHSKRPVWLIGKPALQEKCRQALVAVRAEHLLNRKIATLSGGEQRRVVLALALAGGPELLLLDEPDAGVDEKGLQLFYDILADLKNMYDTSILMVSHNFPLIAKYADNILFINAGELIETGPPDIVFSGENFHKIFK